VDTQSGEPSQPGYLGSIFKAISFELPWYAKLPHWMDETPEQKFDRISRAVQESILRNYPNPERCGCPGDDVVRGVAARTELEADEVWEHITHCSPCYAIFLNAKQEFRGNRAIRRRTALGLIAAGVAAIPVIVVTRVRAPRYNQQIGEWNLEAISSSRGAGTPAQEAGSQQRALRKRGFIRVKLPLGSEPGEYHLQIRKTEDGSAVATSSGKAEIVSGHTLSSFPIDLSSLPTGSYFAAIRGTSRIWHVYPLLLN
jgi:hypothetical protein